MSNADQPRDDHGRFSSNGGGGSSAKVKDHRDRAIAHAKNAENHRDKTKKSSTRTEARQHAQKASDHHAKAHEEAREAAHHATMSGHPTDHEHAEQAHHAANRAGDAAHEAHSHHENWDLRDAKAAADLLNPLTEDVGSLRGSGKTAGEGGLRETIDHDTSANDD